MISFTRLKIQSLKSYEKLKEHVDFHLVDDDVIVALKKYLGKNCDEILIEYPYYDEDYLSIYYIHYSQKLRPYDKLCCRLHVLRNEEYYGYIVLRPTIKGTKIGKSLLKPELFVKERAYLMLHKFKAHVIGNKMEIRCFPWKSQETDISVCAHTATWTVIRYFGNKFRDYADVTIGELVEHTKNDWGRKTPSLGLTPVQVSDLFKDFNFSPMILQNDKEENDGFLDELISYVESGIPVIGFLYPIKHAISIIGHGLLDLARLENDDIVNKLKDDEINIISHSKLMQELYVADDHYFPYRKIPIEAPSQSSDLIYGLHELKYAVVPLYRRMQLAYSEVYERFRVWRKEKIMNWEKFCVCRIYITSANSLKEEALKSSNMNETLRDVILNMTLPRFVWCIDLAGIENFKNNLTSGRIIIDTTSPTMEEEIWLLRHDGEKIEFVDFEQGDRIKNNKYSLIEVEIKPYNLYLNNLIEVNPV